MSLWRLWYPILLCIAAVQSVESVKSKVNLESPLTLEERLQIFGQPSSEELPSYEYATLEKIDVTGLKPYRKRPPTFLQYKLTLNGQIITLTLKPNTEVLTPDCVVYQYKPNGTKTLSPCRKSQGHCLYTGKSDSHNDSWVAANICNGLEGVISISNTSLYVSPLRTKNVATATNSTDNSLHVIYRYHGSKQKCATNSVVRSSSIRSIYKITNPEATAFIWCYMYSRFVQDYALPKHDDDIIRPIFHKRSTTKRYVEMNVFVDPSMVAFHSDKIQDYVQTVVNVAAQRYQDESLGEDVRLTLKAMHIIHSYEMLDTEITIDAKTTLNNFCKWQSEFLKKQAVDVSVLITRIDIEYPLGDSKTTGLANPKGACDEHRRCAVVEDTGPNMGLSMAHEIGHLLGMSHDGEGNNCDGGIMSISGSTGRAAFKWSSCSASALHEFINTRTAACLVNVPNGLTARTRDVKPGTLYTAEEQCRLLLGQESVVCPVPGQDVCESLACRTSPGEMCRAYGFPLMDGTDCNNTRNWCIEGKCEVMTRQSARPVNGGWSAWTANYSTCTRTCGGGVKVKRRRCDSPAPQYGGKPCLGESVQAEICNLQKCQFDYRATQCKSKNNVYGHGYIWEPMTDLTGDSSCIIRCVSTNTSRTILYGPDSFKDGTECVPAILQPFSRCMDGKCRSFGCDGHLDSGYQYDKCGVCNGTGVTCREVAGVYSKNNISQVFTSVVTIPKRSTNIVVRQFNMYCFLALAVNGQRVLNEFVQGRSNAWMQNGVLMKYNRNPEFIEITGPLQEDIEIQVYRRYDYRQYMGVSPNITYSYFTPNIISTPSSYAWVKTSSKCSKECGSGITVPTVICKEYNLPVDDHFCDITKKPSEAPELCNTHLCPPEWRTSDWSTCSVSCGQGIRTRNLTCSQKDKAGYSEVTSEMCRGKDKPLLQSNCTMGVCAVWKSGPWSSCSKSCGEGKRERWVACYRQGDDKIIKPEFCPRNMKPSTIEFCNNGKCRLDLTGAACNDHVANCKQVYGFDICVGIYSRWAEANCMKSCGVCSPVCDDDMVCSQYIRSGLDICKQYPAWSREHCPKVCGHCDCKDISETPCHQYDSKYCTDPNYSGWMAANCRNYCHHC